MEQFFSQYSGTIAVLTLFVSIIALIVACLSLYEQKHSKFQLEALPMVAGNHKCFAFESLVHPKLKITNNGSKAITVTDISVCIGKDKFSLSQGLSDKINVFIEPGKVEFYPYERDYVIEMATYHIYKKDYRVRWEITTSDGKKARCKSNNRLSDFFNVNL